MSRNSFEIHWIFSTWQKCLLNPNIFDFLDKTWNWSQIYFNCRFLELMPCWGNPPPASSFPGVGRLPVWEIGCTWLGDQACQMGDQLDQHPVWGAQVAVCRPTDTISDKSSPYASFSSQIVPGIQFFPFNFFHLSSSSSTTLASPSSCILKLPS